MDRYKRKKRRSRSTRRKRLLIMWAVIVIILALFGLKFTTSFSATESNDTLYRSSLSFYGLSIGNSSGLMIIRRSNPHSPTLEATFEKEVIDGENNGVQPKYLITLAENKYKFIVVTLIIGVVSAIGVKKRRKIIRL
ncbi:MAG: hypothetical protein NTY34_02435 [Candidatus Omnitrophica bacterium]|nr:hypothetical protein [Candidatus Omnitrophota bacterium]